MPHARCALLPLPLPFVRQVHCDKVTSGSVRRTINCLCFSADGAWLFVGTASGDILTINVARKAVQVCRGSLRGCWLDHTSHSMCNLMLVPTLWSPRNRSTPI